MSRRLAPLALALLLCRCGTADTGTMPLAPRVPVPLPIVAATPYRIQPGDVIGIRLPLSPELDEEVTVRPDGGISTTVVQDTPAAGLTVPALEAALDRAYGRILTAPHLSAIVRTAMPMRVFVAGEVMHPGEIRNESGPITLAEAIASAGGMKLAGDRSRVFILRRGPDGRGEFLRTAYAALTAGQDPGADVQLASSDVVFVPRTSIALGYMYFNQYLQQFVPVSWGFSYVLNQAFGSTTVTQPGAVVGVR